jgi:hypothetical protein
MLAYGRLDSLRDRLLYVSCGLYHATSRGNIGLLCVCQCLLIGQISSLEPACYDVLELMKPPLTYTYL